MLRVRLSYLLPVFSTPLLQEIWEFQRALAVLRLVGLAQAECMQRRLCSTFVSCGSGNGTLAVSSTQLRLVFLRRTLTEELTFSMSARVAFASFTITPPSSEVEYRQKPRKQFKFFHKGRTALCFTPRPLGYHCIRK